MQRYASNATFTINLLHSVVGVDYFNIFQGPSNGLELLNFFDEALQVDRADGSAALECGDVVVMDNCGFHHACHIEPLLQNMLNRCGIEFIYHPPYSPHLNISEYCFNQIKQFLQQHQLLAMNETKVAIGEAICHTGSAATWYKTEKKINRRGKRGEQLHITDIKYSRRLMLKQKYLQYLF